jgi:ABC-type antimicrobial peptide transport system permease subunit
LNATDVGINWSGDEVEAKVSGLITAYMNGWSHEQLVAYAEEFNEGWGYIDPSSGDGELRKVVADWIKTGYPNFLDETKSRDYFYGLAHTEIKAEKTAALAAPYLGQEIWISTFVNRNNINKKVKIVGIAVLPDNLSITGGLIVGAQSLLNELNPNVGDYKFAVAPLSGDRAVNLKLVKFSYETNDGVMYLLRNEVTSTLGQVNSLIEGLAKVFLYVGIGFAVFASLLMLNFIATSISYKKREIGVLRAVGARSSDVFGIFFNESFIIACINFLIAAIAVFGVSTYLNTYFRGQLGLLITLLAFGIRQIALIFVVSVVAAFVASFIPTIRISGKKPIDAINNR